MFEGFKPRDPARIDEMIELLRVAWKKHPDWRLCQVISNCAYGTLDEQQRARIHAMNNAAGRPGRSFDPFYVEDVDIKPEIEKLAEDTGRATDPRPTT